MNIYQKLVEVRKAVPYLQKDNKGFQFQYVSSSQTLGTLKEKMDEMGLLLIPSVTRKTVLDHNTKKGEHEYFTELEMRFTWVNAEKPEETVVCDWYGQGLDSGEKGVGKAMTYSEKYFLLKFFNIATDKDDPDAFQEKMNGPDKQKQSKQQDPAKKLTAADWTKVFDTDFLMSSDKTAEAVKAWRLRRGKEIMATIANSEEADKLKGYLNEMEAEYTILKCPETDAQVTAASCAGKPCKVGCPEFTK